MERMHFWRMRSRPRSPISSAGMLICRIVRHGYVPEREVMTGIGPVAVRQPRVRDREAAAADPGRSRFTPAILPPYVRRSKSVESLLPLLYLKGISKGDFSEALAALFGKDAVGLSASTVGNAGNECGRQYRPDARYLI